MRTKRRRDATEPVPSQPHRLKPVPPQTLRDVEHAQHPGGDARSRLGNREQFAARDHLEYLRAWRNETVESARVAIAKPALDLPIDGDLRHIGHRFAKSD